MRKKYPPLEERYDFEQIKSMIKAGMTRQEIVSEIKIHNVQLRKAVFRMGANWKYDLDQNAIDRRRERKMVEEKETQPIKQASSHFMWTPPPSAMRA